MNIKEHIESGNYPTDTSGRALVPMRNGEVVTICAIDAPGGFPIAGFGANLGVTDWTVKGGYFGGGADDLDLMPPSNVKEAVPSKLYIVWNEAKTEGYATTEYQLAYEVRKGSDTNCHHEATGEQAVVAVGFCAAYSDQNCTIEEIER